MTADGALDRWIDELRRRLDRGELTGLGPLCLGDGLGELPGARVVRIMLADLDHLDDLPPSHVDRWDPSGRRHELLDRFRRLREVIG